MKIFFTFFAVSFLIVLKFEYAMAKFRSDLKSQDIHSYLSRRSGLHPNSDLKDGIIHWIKANIDPELVETWYHMPVAHRACVKSGLEYIFSRTPFNKLMETNKIKHRLDNYIDYFCPRARKNVDQLYIIVKKFMLKAYVWYKTLPDSIREPIEKLETLAHVVDINDKHRKLFVDSLEEIFYANHDDRRMLAVTHPIVSAFLTGNLRNPSIDVISTQKQLYNRTTTEHTLFIAYGRLLVAIENELIAFFKSRNYFDSEPCENNKFAFSKKVESMLTKELRHEYEDFYVKYDENLGMFRLAALLDDYERVHSNSNRLVIGIMNLWIFWCFLGCINFL